MIFEGKFRTALIDQQEVSLAPDLPAKITYLFTPAGESRRFRIGKLGDLENLALLDTFLFYPEKSETRDKDQKTRQHENPVVGLTLGIQISSWSDQGYSLKLDCRYKWKVPKLSIGGVWDETRMVVTPRGKNALVVALTGTEELEKAVNSRGGVLLPADISPAPPRLIRHTFPKYPARLLRCRCNALVTVLCVINKEGRILPETLALLHSPHTLFARNSLKEITENWLFAPSRLNGQPISISETVEVTFSMR